MYNCQWSPGFFNRLSAVAMVFTFASKEINCGKMQKLRIMRLISHDSSMSSRQIAKSVEFLWFGILHISGLVKKGF